ncbi:T3SS effector HopA1 family protein [Larkinella sp. C7]|jgi:hypothetical protein|uniref:T3SS effector HopA1 family protein n=1 Tax=Larkinella sp. C7 TaxID=2576607 RepID=UPI0011113FBD|nr:T3SS effector HopA1 family protein [Larkinella sp. C7]
MAYEPTEQLKSLVRLIRISEDKQQIFLNGDDKTGAICQDMLAKKYIFDTTDLKAVLQVWLYREHYIRPNQKPTEGPNDVDQFTHADSGVRLDFWNTGGWRYTTGAVRPARHSNEVVLLKGSKARWVSGGQYIETGVATDSGWILLESNEPTHEFGTVSDAVPFNWLFGRQLSEGDDRGGIRFYFNLKPTKAAVTCLVREIQNGFNRHEIPFILKFVANPDKYNRADSAVLYTDHRYLNLVAILLQNSYRELSRNEALRPDVPLFVRELAPGLGVAEEPHTGTSFGMDRSFQLADALMEAGQDPDPETRIQNVFVVLRKKEFDPENFHQNPSSPVQYPFLFDHFAKLRSGAWQALPGGGDDGYRGDRFRLVDEIDWFGQPGLSRKPYLLAAVRIAIALCREATWYYDRKTGEWSCNWLTYRPVDGRNEVVYQLLDDSFEEGIEGVRFFLQTVLTTCHQSELLDFVVKSARPTGRSLADGQNRSQPDWHLKDPDLDRAFRSLFQTAASEAIPDEPMADALIERYLDQDRPLGNGYGDRKPERSDLFCPNLQFGLAGFGYYFLHVYDPHQFRPIVLSKSLA